MSIYRPLHACNCTCRFGHKLYVLQVQMLGALLEAWLQTVGHWIQKMSPAPRLPADCMQILCKTVSRPTVTRTADQLSILEATASKKQPTTNGTMIVAEYSLAMYSSSYHSDPLRLALNALRACALPLLRADAPPLSKRLRPRLELATHMLTDFTKLFWSVWSSMLDEVGFLTAHARLSCIMCPRKVVLHHVPTHSSQQRQLSPASMRAVCAAHAVLPVYATWGRPGGGMLCRGIDGQARLL